MTQTALAADWVSLGGGNYHQQKTLLPGFTYDSVVISFRDPSTGAYVYPSVLKVSSTVIDIYTNLAADLTLIYGV